MWDHRELVRIARAGLEACSRAAEAEQAVYGLDAMREVELHPMLANAYSAAGLGVRREWPYPGVSEKRPKFSARARCDLVLTERPGMELVDPVAELLEADRAAETLFGAVAGAATRARPSCEAGAAF